MDSKDDLTIDKEWQNDKSKLLAILEKLFVASNDRDERVHIDELYRWLQTEYPDHLNAEALLKKEEGFLVLTKIRKLFNFKEVKDYPKIIDDLEISRPALDLPAQMQEDQWLQGDIWENSIIPRLKSTDDVRALLKTCSFFGNKETNAGRNEKIVQLRDKKPPSNIGKLFESIPSELNKNHYKGLAYLIKKIEKNMKKRPVSQRVNIDKLMEVKGEDGKLKGFALCCRLDEEKAQLFSKGWDSMSQENGHGMTSYEQKGLYFHMEFDEEQIRKMGYCEFWTQFEIPYKFDLSLISEEQLAALADLIPILTGISPWEKPFDYMCFLEEQTGLVVQICFYDCNTLTHMAAFESKCLPELEKQLGKENYERLILKSVAGWRNVANFYIDLEELKMGVVATPENISNVVDELSDKKSPGPK